MGIGRFRDSQESGAVLSLVFGARIPSIGTGRSGGARLAEAADLPVFTAVRKFGQGIARRAIGGALTSPLLRWTWAPGDLSFTVALGDFRPTDIDTVTEMASGRYLLGGKLVDTDGISPFAAPISHFGWRHELHGFGWLRHFSDVHDQGLRKFARTLVLDWIGRHERNFDRDIWAIDLTARRVFNWLRHLDILLEGTNDAQKRAINRALGRQIRSIHLRARWSDDPIDIMAMRMVLLAASLSENRSTDVIARHLDTLEKEIDRQFDATGLHRSRSSSIQVEILSELTTLREALARRDQVHLGALPTRMSTMHDALASLTLGTGELGYFNGTGQEPADLLFSLQAAGGAKAPRTALIGGYGTLRAARAVVVADSGIVPDRPYARRAHAGALSFEFSHGTELIIGNCGPAPDELHGQERPFRLGAAHSAPTVDYRSAAHILSKGPDRGTLVANGKPPELEIDTEEHVLKLSCHAYEASAGVRLERWLTLMMGGDTLVGQDRVTAAGHGITGQQIVMRFHFGPGVEVDRQPGSDIVNLALPSGAVWSFLWEGATAEIDDSVRQSAYFGFYRTKQILLTAPARDGHEIAWILTRPG